MKGIVLAAGKGSRFAELNFQHKSLAVVQKKHIIDYSMDLLVGADTAHSLVDEIVVVVGYRAEAVMEYLGRAYRGVPVTYVYQREHKGIAHAVLTAKDALNDDFIMCLADEIMVTPRLREMINEFNDTNATCVCGTVIDGQDFSMKPIAYDVDDTGRVLQVKEKPKEYHNDIRGIGECIFKREALEYLERLEPDPVCGEFEMGHWIQLLVDDGKLVRVFDLADGYVNVNYAKDIDAADQLLKRSQGKTLTERKYRIR